MQCQLIPCGYTQNPDVVLNNSCDSPLYVHNVFHLTEAASDVVDVKLHHACLLLVCTGIE